MAARNRPHLIQPYLPEILPALYQNSLVDKSLIREVQFGPMKELIDDGAELRKSTYDCMTLLIDSCSGKNKHTMGYCFRNNGII